MKKSKISENTIIMNLSELKKFLKNKILLKVGGDNIYKMSKREFYSGLTTFMSYTIFALPKKCKLKPLDEDYKGKTIYNPFIGNKFFADIRGCWKISYNFSNKLFYLTKTWKKI